jgi:4-hydroxy-tetrahydrodipicolinate reductase
MINRQTIRTLGVDKIKVMINGIPGSMATTVLRHLVLDDRFELIPASLTGPEIKTSRLEVDNRSIRLIHRNDRNREIERLIRQYGFFISADFTLPSAVNENAEFYCKKKLPFVMGTTGGDSEALEREVKKSTIPAVIAPNMGKQIVGFQAMLEYAGREFPDLFKGYTLEITESHQKNKADTSGTAKALARCFNRLGVLFTPEQISKVRNPGVQRSRWGVPEQYLDGHAWHMIRLISDDKTVSFEFTIKINGRTMFAKGTLDALFFLDEKVKEGVSGKIFTMIDVLKITSPVLNCEP